MSDTLQQLALWSPDNDRHNTVQVTAGNRADLLADLTAKMSARQPFAVATLNLDHVVKFHKDPEFHKAYLAHSHITADGNPIVWLSRLAGEPIDLIPGSELIAPLMAACAREGVPVAFLGSTQDTLDEAGEALRQSYPGLQIAVTIAPEMGFDPCGASADACIETLRQAGAGLCCVALGAPKQEQFAAYALSKGVPMGFVSIGAGLDFIAGSQVRAPAWVRKIAAEWIWRMLSNPKRLAMRYMACIAIMPRLTLRAVRRRRIRG